MAGVKETRQSGESEYKTRNIGARKTRQYDEGKKAFESSVPVDRCPYRAGDQRLAWLLGWYDARTWTKWRV